MISKPDDLPSDLASALAALQAEREARLQAEAVAASAREELSANEALIAYLELRIEKLKPRTVRAALRAQGAADRAIGIGARRARHHGERGRACRSGGGDENPGRARLHAQAAGTQALAGRRRARARRHRGPEELCLGGSRLAKLGVDVIETLEEIPRRVKLIETVREKFTCRDCEKISQPPAPFHATPRGLIGPQLLATILFDKFGMHITLNRQSVRFKAERIYLLLSTLADQVGHGTFAVIPHIIPDPAGPAFALRQDADGGVSRPEGFHLQPLAEPGVSGSHQASLPPSPSCQCTKSLRFFTRGLLQEETRASQAVMEALVLSLQPDSQRLVDVARHRSILLPAVSHLS